MKPNQTALKEKAVIELDGQEIEIILQALSEDQIEAFKQGKIYKSRQIELIYQKLFSGKIEFHKKWLDHFRERELTRINELKASNQ